MGINQTVQKDVCSTERGHTRSWDSHNSFSGVKSSWESVLWLRQDSPKARVVKAWSPDDPTEREWTL